MVENAELTAVQMSVGAPGGHALLGEPLVDAATVAAHLGVDVSTVYRLATSGDLPVVVIGRAKRFRVSDVRAFVEQATRGGAQAARVDRVQQLVGGAARCRPSARSNDLDATRGKSVHPTPKQEPWRPPPPYRPEDN